MTDDFAIFRCQLQPVTDLHITNQMGEALHALFFHLIGLKPLESLKLQLTPYDIGNHPLEKSLHDGGTYKPFSVNDLMLESEMLNPLVVKRDFHIKCGQNAVVQFAGLSSQMVQTLQKNLIEVLPLAAGIQIDHNWWVLRAVEKIRSTGINNLIAYHHQTKPPHQITFRFQTPTTFKRKGLELPFPLPSLVFGTLRRRWEEITGLELSPLLSVFADYFIEVGDYDLNSHTHFIQNENFQAFTGTVTFHLKRSSIQLKKDRGKFPEADELWHGLHNNMKRRDELARALSLLAEFAIYAGVGMKTTQGMGSVTTKFK